MNGISNGPAPWDKRQTYVSESLTQKYSTSTRLDLTAFPKAGCGHPVRFAGGPHVCSLCAGDIEITSDMFGKQGWACGQNAAPLRVPREEYARCCGKCAQTSVMKRRTEIMDFIGKQAQASRTPHEALEFKEVVRREMRYRMVGHNEPIAEIDEIVVWDTGLLQAALRGWELFKGEPFNRPMPTTLVVAGGATYVVRADVSEDGKQQALASEFIASTPHFPIVIDAFAMKEGRPLDDPSRDFFAKLAAMFAFMDIELVRRESVKLPRQTRRALQRARKHVPNVTVVRLRRMTSADRAQHGESEVEWSHRWMVRGHWRQQWYSKTEEHKLVYIAPYIKGPEGKPFLPQRPVVKVVDR